MATFKSPDFLTILLYIFLILDIGTTFIPSQIVPVIGTIIPFIVYALYITWFYRVYHNLQALGVKGLRFSIKRAIISFLIPGLNLFEPTKAMKELWKASEPVANVSDEYSWKQLEVPRGLGVWWFLAVVTRFHEVHFFGTGSENITQIWETVVTPIAVLIINILTIIIVRRIDSRQEKKKAITSMGQR